MKAKNICIVSFIYLILLFTNCSFFQTEKRDSDFITDFDSLEWNENYIFAASQYPPQISVWNSDSKKLVRNYDFFKADSGEHFLQNGGKHLQLYTMQVIKKNIWCIVAGNQCSLVKIDVETGKTSFIDLKKNYEHLEYIPQGDGGNGAILVAPFVQYNHDFEIKLFNLSGEIIHTYKIAACDIDFLTAKGQYKDGYFYICANTYNYVGPGEPSGEIYKLIKLNLLSDENEIIDFQTSKILEKDFIKNNISEVYKKQYLTSFSLKSGDYLTDDYMIALDIIGSNNSGYVEGRFLFETNDLVSGNYYYTGINLIDTRDEIGIFPRMYIKTENQYSMIGNDGNDLYAVFYNYSKKDIYCMSNSNIIFMDKRNDIVWCSKNPYLYLNESKKWIYDNEGIYKVDLRNKKVSLYLNDGSCLSVLKIR